MNDHFKYLPAITFFLILSTATAETFRTEFNNNWGPQGFSLQQQTGTDVEVIFSVTEMEIRDFDINGETLQNVIIPGVILPNEEGAPNLPALSRFIAIPEGSIPELEIIDYRSEVYHDLNLVPAFAIPKRTDSSPTQYIKNPEIYEKDADYPAEPVIISETQQMRGVDVVMLGITPFQYNPVTRDLTVYLDLRVRISFNGGSGHFGEDRLRNRWWEPILRQNLLNYTSLRQIDFNRISQTDEDNVEYLIIVPNDSSFYAWADTIKQWRTEQGIITGITPLSEIGGNNADLIEQYIDDAYHNWDIPPVAILLLSDYQSTGDLYGITSPLYSGQAADNMYADIDNNNLPDLNIARITAQNAQHLETMIGKMLDYERTPCTDENFYMHPVLAGGWETPRWFTLNTEILYGYFSRVHGKEPVREYEIISGYPGSSWSSNVNTYMIVDYFGPTGLGYVPATPSYLNDWGGNAARINADFNSGAFIAQHCDHGEELGWSHPSYTVNDLSGLSNNAFPYIFSDNCSTGEYTYYTACWAEAIHRMEHGAIGVNAASGVSYSFVADVLVWGFYDGMWPDFDPGYGQDPLGGTDLRPGFATIHAKYYLQASSWPYNPYSKTITYHQFHHHGGAFMTLYSEVPESLTVSHDNWVSSQSTSFTVTADNESFIGISQSGSVLGRADGTGVPQVISIVSPEPGAPMRVTVTKQNHFRYIADVPVNIGTPQVDVELTYNSGSPVPASGGHINFDCHLANADSITIIADAWLDLAYESNPPTTVVLRNSLYLEPGCMIDRPNVSYYIPPSYPAGDFTLTGKVGAHPDTVWDESGFSFQKLGHDFGADGFIPFIPPGGFPDPFANDPEIPDEDEQIEALTIRTSPNPFNPTTVASIELRDANFINLAVYDISGRKVAELVNGWRDAGMHEVVFDGSGLASGVYIYQIQTGDLSATGKIVLMK